MLAVGNPDQDIPESSGELPEQTTRALAEGKNPLPDGVPVEPKKAVLG